MSLYAPGDFGYLQQAEAYFLSHSKIGVMLSSKDVELLRRWRDGGVPIEVVCYGIRRAFYEFKEPPRALFRCRKLVDAELKAWKERLVGEGRGETLPLPWALPGRELPDPTDPRRRLHRERLRGQAPPEAPEPPAREIPKGEEELSSWYHSMWRLMELGQRAQGPHARAAYRWAYRQMNELRQEARVARDDREIVQRLGLAIGHVEAQMYQSAYEQLSPEEQKRLDGQLPANMEEALGRMSPQARQSQLRIWRRRLLEEALEIAPFFVP